MEKECLKSYLGQEDEVLWVHFVFTLSITVLSKYCRKNVQLNTNFVFQEAFVFQKLLCFKKQIPWFLVSATVVGQTWLLNSYGETDCMQKVENG